MSRFKLYLLLGVIRGSLGFLLDDCGKENQGKIQYTIKNLIQEPTFIYTTTMSVIGCKDTVLTRYMERACDESTGTFKNFSTTYFPNVGYYVSAINGVEETFNYSYWELIEHSDGVQKEVGHSSYVPQPNDHIAWNLTIIDFSQFQN